ncbi:MAG: caspase family protein [Flavobacteriales bacterium]|nr:caspase family protein [Flavobacteriales bacterium]MCB9197477.1 caspase family protein [Flavobacteriales bacterium]
MNTLKILVALIFPTLYYGQNVELITQEEILGVINDLHYSPDGKFIASTNTRGNNIMIWDVRSSKLIGQLIGHEEQIQEFEFDQLSDQMVSLDQAGKCLFWDLDTWSVIDSLKLKPSQHHIQYLNSGTIITLDGNSIQKITSTGSEEIYRSKLPLNSLAIDQLSSPVIYTSTEKNFIRIELNTKSESFNLTLDKKKKIHSIYHFNTSENLIYFDDGSVLVTDKDGKQLTSFNISSNIIDLSISARNNRFAVVGNNGEIDIWNLKGELISEFKDDENSEKVQAISINHDGSYAATTGYKKLLLDKIYSNNNVIQIWDIKRQIVSKTLKGDVNAIDAFAFSPSENHLFVLRGQELDIWSLNSAQRLGTYTFPDRKIEVKDRGKDNVTAAVDQTKSDAQEKANEEIQVDQNKINKWKSIATGDITTIKDQAKDKIQERTDAVKTFATEESKLAGKAAFSRFGFQEDKIVVSPKGNYMLTIFKNDEIRLYSLSDGLPTYIDYVKTGQKEFYDILFDHEEELIIVGGAGKTPVSIIPIANIQDISKNQLEVTETEDLKMNGMFQAANALALSNDGKYLVAVFNTGRIVAWETRSWWRVLDFNPKITMTRKPFVGFSEDGKKLFVNTGVGIYSYEFASVASYTANQEDALSKITGVKKARVDGFPVMTHMPLNHVISIADNNINFMDVINDEVNKSLNIPCNLVTDVQVNKFGYVGVSLKNGTLTVFDPKNGKERFTMVGEDENAIFKTSEQYYKITKEGQQLVTFRVGKEAYPFEQFDAKFNRPDIVLTAMNSEDEGLIQIYKKAYEKRLAKLGLNESQLGNITSLPELTIGNLSDIPLNTDERNIEVQISAVMKSGELDRLMIWNNDVPIYGIKGKDISGQTVSDKLSIPLTSGKNKIQIAVSSSSGLESLKETIEIHCNAIAKPNLYLISIGTSLYKDTRYNLNYAAKDAMDLAKVFGNSRNTYDNIYVKTLTDKEVTVTNINQLRSFFAEAKIDDVVMIFVAGHGLLDANYDYYYGTHDVNFNKPADKGLAYNILESLLDNIAPLKRILIMDTCHSGEVEEEEILLADNEEEEGADDVMFRSSGPALTTVEGSPSKMMKELFTDLRRGTGATVLSSAGGAEYAMESSDWKNGLFTYSLLFGLRNGGADLNADGVIMLSELQIYVSDMVTKLSHGKQTPTARIQNIELDYPIW